MQLANFVGNGGVTVRWHQTADYGYTPNPSMENVFMAVAIDTYDEPSGIHPRLVNCDAYDSAKNDGDCQKNTRSPPWCLG